MRYHRQSCGSYPHVLRCCEQKRTPRALYTKLLLREVNGNVGKIGTVGFYLIALLYNTRLARGSVSQASYSERPHPTTASTSTSTSMLPSTKPSLTMIMVAAAPISPSSSEPSIVPKHCLNASPTAALSSEFCRRSVQLSICSGFEGD